MSSSRLSCLTLRTRQSPSLPSVHIAVLLSPTLDPGVFDYSLRCVNGPFKDRFAYINLGPEGEIIGSGADPDVTLTIEDESVEAKHAKIVFTPEYQYVLTNASKSGSC